MEEIKKLIDALIYESFGPAHPSGEWKVRIHATKQKLIAAIEKMRQDHHEHINRAQITVSTAELRAMKAEEKLTKARVGAARYVNAMGRHITDSWREHFIDSCELSVDNGNPYFPLVAHKLVVK
jgi:uncharacterized protein YehS (DUF1456 family)